MTSPYLLLPRRSIAAAKREIELRKSSNVLVMAGEVVSFQKAEHKFHNPERGRHGGEVPVQSDQKQPKSA